MTSLAQPLARLFDEVPAAWHPVVDAWRQTPAAQALITHVDARVVAGATVYPAQVLRALTLTPLDQVRVVILGQDPYHGPGQAHGLAFSVPDGTRTPPSLRNIFNELQREFGRMPAHTDLSSWAKQGVLLLNAVLTVEAGLAASHQGKGWERFTDAVIRLVNDQPRPVVFILWGSYAQRKAAFVDRQRHLVLASAHPSPLSAHNGFFGSRPFSKANEFLIANGQDPIDWKLT